MKYLLSEIRFHLPVLIPMVIALALIAGMFLFICDFMASIHQIKEAI